MGVLVLIVLAAALAGTAVYLRLKRAPAGEQPAAPDAAPAGAVVSDAGAAAVPDAAAIGPVATPDAMLAPVDAGEPVAVDAAPASPEDKSAQAKVLLDQANDAIQEGAFERALRAADASLALKKAPRAHLARAKALQRLDRIDDALAAIAAAEQMAPKYASVFELRGRILWAARRKEEARVQFELFLELEPTGARAAQIQKFLDEPP